MFRINCEKYRRLKYIKPLCRSLTCQIWWINPENLPCPIHPNLQLKSCLLIAFVLSPNWTDRRISQPYNVWQCFRWRFLCFVSILITNSPAVIFNGSLRTCSLIRKSTVVKNLRTSHNFWTHNKKNLSSENQRHCATEKWREIWMSVFQDNTSWYQRHDKSFHKFIG